MNIQHYIFLFLALTLIYINIILQLAKALTAALSAGSRRRSLAAKLSTPPPALGAKRPLKKSPDTVASTSASPHTISPDPKRFMTTSSEKSESGSAGSHDVSQGPTTMMVPPVELFPPSLDGSMNTPGLSMGLIWLDTHAARCNYLLHHDEPSITI